MNEYMKYLAELIRAKDRIIQAVNQNLKEKTQIGETKYGLWVYDKKYLNSVNYFLYYSIYLLVNTREKKVPIF